MSSPTRPAAGELDTLRSRTLAELEHQLELQRIDPGEFERRTEQAMEASSALELRPLVADLLELDASAGADAPAAYDEHEPALPDTPPSGAEPDHDWAIAIMSGSNRSGQWEPAENVTALAIMGGVRLDFREAAFIEGVVTRVSAFCLMGGCEIIVPPDIHVSVAGTGLMGGFGHVRQTAADADAPRLHISGLAVMGGVEIKVRDVGEEESDSDSP